MDSDTKYSSLEDGRRDRSGSSVGIFFISSRRRNRTTRTNTACFEDEGRL
jgi:hypothetical protein